MNRTVFTLVAAALGATGWWLGLRIGPGPTALNAGGWYLLILVVAGFIVAFFERDLSWTSLAGLYAGQVVALFVQALGRYGLTGAEPLAWQPLFIVSVTLAGAVGGAVGALAAGAWRSRPEPAATEPARTTS